jgi:hypothetical protein
MTLQNPAPQRFTPVRFYAPCPIKLPKKRFMLDVLESSVKKSVWEQPF